MSGPKVVRVVTREELVAAGEALLRRLDGAVNEWQRMCAATAAPSQVVQEGAKRRTELEALLRADKFPAFFQAAAREIDFLAGDAAARRERAAQAQAAERTRVANGRSLAGTLLREGVGLTDDVRKALEGAAAGKLGLAEMDALLAKARGTMFSIEGTKASVSQVELGKKLAASEKSLTLNQWRADQEVPDAALLAMHSHLTELEMLGDAGAAASLSEQLAGVVALAGGATRQMRMDTLSFAIKRAKDAAVLRASLLRDARLLISELAVAAHGSAALASLNALEAKADTSTEDIRKAVVAGQAELDKAAMAAAAAARRRTILAGLSELGYELHEGLSTATANAGRIVIRAPAQKDYGVEIVAGAATDKVQVRSVAFNVTHDKKSDIDAEQSWCGDFGKLQTVLQKLGCEAVVEKALGVGAVPVKYVELSSEEREQKKGTAPAQKSKGLG